MCEDVSDDTNMVMKVGTKLQEAVFQKALQLRTTLPKEQLDVGDLYCLRQEKEVRCCERKMEASDEMCWLPRFDDVVCSLAELGWAVAQMQIFPASLMVALKDLHFVEEGDSMAVSITEFETWYEGLYHLLSDISRIERN